ncbi:hypothetical protein FB451DRAFT_1416530 [Mycena latifolia]|nr:hypothetical protein FB451DRAFT_1416530 [Mycena latifolia]
MHRCVNAACRAAIMRVSMADLRVVMGQEALFSMWGLGVGTDDAAVLQGALRSSRSAIQMAVLRIRIVYGATDGMVPAKRRAWLEGKLEALGLIRADDADAWTEVPDAGHDDVLFLMDKILTHVK